MGKVSGPARSEILGAYTPAPVRPYRAADIAQMVGITADQFRRHDVRERLYAEGLPRPYIGLLWDRGTIDAWRGRFHPLAPARVANDLSSAPLPAGAAGDREKIHRAYGRSPAST